MVVSQNALHQRLIIISVHIDLVLCSTLVNILNTYETSLFIWGIYEFVSQQLCDVQWEPEFRMEAGVSSKEALCLYLEHPFVDDCPAGKAQRHDTISQEDLHKMFEKLDVMSHLLEQI